MTPVVTAVVAGVGRSRFSRHSGATTMSLAAPAIAAALRDAKLAPHDVDGVVRFDRDALWEYDLPGVCGVTNLGFYNAVPSGPGGAPALLRMAAMAITEGLASVVLCHHARDGVARAAPPPAAEAAGLARLQRVSEADVARTTLAHRRAALRTTVPNHARRFFDSRGGEFSASSHVSWATSSARAGSPTRLCARRRTQSACSNMASRFEAVSMGSRN